MNARSKIFAWITFVESGFRAFSIEPSTSRMTTSAGTIGGCRIFCTAENKHTVKTIPNHTGHVRRDRCNSRVVTRVAVSDNTGSSSTQFVALSIPRQFT